MSVDNRPLQRPPLGPPPPFDREVLPALDGLPQIQGWLSELNLDTIPAMREGTRAAMPAPTDEELSLGGAYTVEERTVPGPDITLIICRPRASAQPAPVLYWIHGGGMIMGSARDNLTDIVTIAQQVGAAVVAVEYRLAPETPHPGPVEDCYAGLTWTAQHADDLGLDADRIMVFGQSAGGGLAAAVTLLARDRGGPALAGQLLLCPMLDDRDATPSTHQLADAPLWNRTLNNLGWRALLGENYGRPDVSPYAAPARAHDLSGLPPTFIDVGSADLFRDEDVDYANRIWQAGGDAELHVWAGAFHGSDGLAPHAAISRSAATERLNWLHRQLDRP
ncbi:MULTISPECIES: alpha/beta hydrolase [unclassified Nonomuraea]|uniref:alpha/beta hydrolase n=1 Tax=unclassified Nonomuraea TaxID=2593643 RepID=UPI0033F273E0